jgi:hypothetical protein
MQTEDNPKPIERTHGAFFGSEIDHFTCEALAIAKIDRKLLAVEGSLYSRKWFDYRRLHPTMATYLFAHHYNIAYGRFMGEAFDHKKRFMAAFKGKDVMTAREVKSFWKLRQKTDDLGIRYDFFCRHVMQWCMINGWRQPPRPAHAATNDDMLVWIMNQWAEEQNAKIQWAKDPHFAASNWRGANDQVAYEEYLLEQIKSKPMPQYALHAALYIYDALRIETAIGKLPASAVQAAIEFEQRR